MSQSTARQKTKSAWNWSTPVTNQILSNAACHTLQPISTKHTRQRHTNQEIPSEKSGPFGQNQHGTKTYTWHAILRFLTNNCQLQVRLECPQGVGKTTPSPALQTHRKQKLNQKPQHDRTDKHLHCSWQHRQTDKQLAKGGGQAGCLPDGQSPTQTMWSAPVTFVNWTNS